MRSPQIGRPGAIRLVGRASRPGFTPQVYTLGVGLLILRPSPSRPERGALSFPLFYAPRIRKANPAGGGEEKARVHCLGCSVKCIRGEVYRGYYFCTSSFCHRCSRYLLRN